MKIKIIISILISSLLTACSDSNENKNEPKVLSTKTELTEQIKESTSNEIKLQNDKDFYNVKKEEFVDKEIKVNNEPSKKEEVIENKNEQEEKSKVVGFLKGANEIYIKTKEKIPGTADEGLKIIKEKTDQGAEFAKDYAKNWLKESWEESKKRTQEAKLKRIEEEAKK